MCLNVLCSIDANADYQHRLARYINDSPKRYANCAPKLRYIGGRPRVLLFAIKTIASGTELRYDYGGGMLLWRKVCYAVVLIAILNFE